MIKIVKVKHKTTLILYKYLPRNNCRLSIEDNTYCKSKLSCMCCILKFQAYVNKVSFFNFKLILSTKNEVHYLYFKIF